MSTSANNSAVNAEQLLPPPRTVISKTNSRSFWVLCVWALLLLILAAGLWAAAPAGWALYVAAREPYVKKCQKLNAKRRVFVDFKRNAQKCTGRIWKDEQTVRGGHTLWVPGAVNTPMRKSKSPIELSWVSRYHFTVEDVDYEGWVRNYRVGGEFVKHKDDSIPVYYYPTNPTIHVAGSENYGSFTQAVEKKIASIANEFAEEQGNRDSWFYWQLLIVLISQCGAVLAMFLALVMFTIPAFSVLRSKRMLWFARHGVATSAVIQNSRSSGLFLNQRVCYRFKLPDGTSKNGRCRITGEPLPPGQIVTVLYDPRNPDRQKLLDELEGVEFGARTPAD